MEQKPFVVYRSSAGSGKTYTLAKEYLLLALRYKQYFRHILAVTFTNKATAEMKSRIVEYLHDFSNGKRNDMSTELMGKLDMNDLQFQQRCKEVLSNILHGYSQFSVTTIDAFFQKVIRSFAKEVGLTGGFTLELDQDKILDEVVDRLMEDIGKDKSLTDWIVEFTEDRIGEGKGWDIRGSIKGFARALFTEAFKGREKELFEVAENHVFFARFMKKLRADLDGFETKMKAFGERGMVLLEQQDLTIDDIARKKSGPAGYLDKLTKAPYDIGKLELNSYQLPALDTVEAWHTKASDKKEVIAQAVENGLMSLYNEAYEFYLQNRRSYASAQTVMKGLYSFGIILDVAKKLKEYKDEEGIMLISDANQFLKQIVEDNDTPFVYEKVGSFYKNYLIDEFQDTSGFQWDNFAPLVSNSLAEGHRNLIVGDVKQSIYRWRGGDWRLLQNTVVEGFGLHYTQVEQLDNNHRSAENIVRVNNVIFDKASALISAMSSDIEKEDPELMRVLGMVGQAYEDVAQHLPDYKSPNDFAGYLSFSFIPDSVDENGDKVKWEEEALDRVPKMMETLQGKGVEVSDIAFLVRKSGHAKMIMDKLVEYKHSDRAMPNINYNVVSNESLLIAASKSVQILINALVYLNNPKDRIALANLAFKYQNKGDGQEKTHEVFVEEHMENLLPPRMRKEMGMMSKMPLQELIELLIDIFGLIDRPEDYAYLQSFEDKVLEYLRGGRGDVSSFLEWWEEKSSSLMVTMPDTMPAAKVMTIHKAKGLQFKAVIVPFCDWSLDHQSNFGSNRMWLSNENDTYQDMPFFPVGYSSGLKNTYFDKEYYHERAMAFMDNLNLLYVAFTRVEDILLVSSPTPKDKITKVSDVLHQVLKNEYAGLGGNWNEENDIFRFGQLGEVSSEETIDNELVQEPFEYISNSWRNKLSVKFQSREFFKNDGNSIIDNINYGVLIHDLMSRIITPENLPVALDAMKHEGLIVEKQKIELSKTVINLFSNEVVTNWFNPKWKVKTEVPVLPASGEMSRMDRVMIDGKHAMVVDYKSGFPKIEDEKQVKGYKQLLSEMGYKNVEGYLLYIDKVEVVEV